MKNNNSKVVKVLRELKKDLYGSPNGQPKENRIIVALDKACLALEREKKYKVFVADLQERIWLHEAREPSSYILSDLRIFFKQRLKELKLNE